MNERVQIDKGGVQIEPDISFWVDQIQQSECQQPGRTFINRLIDNENTRCDHIPRFHFTDERVLGDVSHELRTPLTAIKGSMEGLMDGVLPATHETYQQIHAEADRLNRLVDDLQELSRVEARAYELDMRSLEVSSLIQTVTKRLAPQAESKRISLDLELTPDLPQVLADEDRAVQILTNLTGNACNTHLKMTGSSFLQGAIIMMSKSRSRRAGGGSGIGLTIARALVEAHADASGQSQQARGRAVLLLSLYPLQNRNSGALQRSAPLFESSLHLWNPV